MNAGDVFISLQSEVLCDNESRKRSDRPFQCQSEPNHCSTKPWVFVMAEKI